MDTNTTIVVTVIIITMFFLLILGMWLSKGKAKIFWDGLTMRFDGNSSRKVGASIKNAVAGTGDAKAIDETGEGAEIDNVYAKGNLEARSKMPLEPSPKVQPPKTGEMQA